MRNKPVVLVCGGRAYDDWKTVWRELQRLKPRKIVTGQARGADALAERWAWYNGIEFQGYPADWRMFGLSAGPIRNSQMLAAEKPDIVLAFPGGTGTADMVNKALRAGYMVKQVLSHVETESKGQAEVVGSAPKRKIQARPKVPAP